MTRYISLAEYLWLAEQVTGIDAPVLAKASRIELADSALHAPAAGFGDQEFYPDLIDKASVLTCRLAWNHPLPDGNKRSAWASLLLFLDLNGVSWKPDPPDVDEAETTMFALAGHDLDENAFSMWLRDRVDLLTPMPQGTDEPDFVSLYGDDDVLTPRMAAHLWGAALYLADTHRSDSELELLSEELPPVVQRLADDSWMRRFASTFEVLAARLARGGFPYEELASCTAEEMALHMVIELAEGFVSDEVVPVDEHLPDRGEADTDFDWAREVLFRDHDVLLLFSTSLDGIEGESDESQGFANLHPRDWFAPFPDQGTL